jgi:DNA invertase Pin-like site-specific DNA recombinase
MPRPIAAFERALIQERVKAGLAHARTKGKRLGRPRRTLDLAQIMVLRESGLSWREVAAKIGCDPSLACRIFTREEGRGENPLATPAGSA